jgi:hypothetical protein
VYQSRDGEDAMKWLRSWWQQIKKHRVAIEVGIILVGVIVLGFAVVWFNGTGFDGYNQVTTAHTISGPSAGTVVRTEVYQPGKALWDWLNLVGILAIPAEVAWYTVQQGKVSERENTDNQRHAVLQAYIDKMSELLLNGHLAERTADGQPKPVDKQVRDVARVRTITVLVQLDARRVGYVFAFLREAELMSATKDDNAISLKNADLHAVNWSQADLRGADLRQANLSGACLQRADLRDANLRGANLRGANLSGAIFFSKIWVSRGLASTIPFSTNFADLSEANLSGANLLGAKVTTEQLDKATALQGAILPDGTKRD